MPPASDADADPDPATEAAEELAPRLAEVLDTLILEATDSAGERGGGFTLTDLHSLYELQAEGDRKAIAELQRLRKEWLAALERFVASLAPSERMRFAGAVHLIGDDLGRLERGALG